MRKMIVKIKNGRVFSITYPEDMKTKKDFQVIVRNYDIENYHRPEGFDLDENGNPYADSIWANI